MPGFGVRLRSAQEHQEEEKQAARAKICKAAKVTAPLTAIRNGAASEPGQSVQRVGQGMSQKIRPAFSTEIRMMPARLIQRMPRPFAFDNPGVRPCRGAPEQT